MRGKFIVIYGPNNIGKTTQVDLMETVWRLWQRPYLRIKYPIYSLEPTGPMINKVLRENMKMRDVDLQEWYARNRRDFEPSLLKCLESGTDVIAEDYVGTGLAWGLTRGIDRLLLEGVNWGLLEPDVAICLLGERFSSGIEKRHRFEGMGQEVWEKNRSIHEQLANELGWRIVSANGRELDVHNRIMEVIGNSGLEFF